MPDSAAFVTSLMALAVETVKHYLCLVAFASITLFDTLRTTSLVLSNYAQDWCDTHGFQNYTAAVHRQFAQYQSFLAVIRCLPQQWRSFTNELWILLLAAAISVGDKTTNMWLTSTAHVIHAASCVSSYMWRRAMVTMDGIVNAGHKILDFCNAIPRWTRFEFRLPMGPASTLWRLLGNLYTRTKAFEARSLRDTGQWLLQKATALHNKAALARNFALESKEELLHYYRSTGPWVVKTFWVLYLLSLLVYFRGHVCRACLWCYWFAMCLAALVQYAASPLNQLHSMRLEMTLRKSMPGAYAYDHEISSRSPHCFRSTLQLYAPLRRPTLTDLPGPLVNAIFSYALTTASTFHWHHRTHALRLSTPNLTFHRLARLARSLGHPVLPSNTIIIDARGGAPPIAPLSPSAPAIHPAWFVARPPSGREQLLDMFAVLAMPAVTSTSWMERVAESMRKGREWVVVVREDVDRVWSFDLGLVVAALQADGFGKVCRGVSVEYRVVVEEGEEDEARMRKVEEMVRQLGEARQLGYRDARLRVVLGGLEHLGEGIEAVKLRWMVRGLVREMGG